MNGDTVGQYRIKNLIGTGGMGVVYEAEHTLLGRPAAVKVLLPQYSQNQSIVARFFNEAKAATAIRHPGIIEIFDFGWHTDGSAYIVMEYLDGETLGSRRKKGPMSWQAVLAVTRQIAGALAAAHNKGIVHRDLKPDNVFIVHDPEVPGGERIKLLDFGIAKLAGEQTGEHKTRTGAVIGTPTYMSPEQCRGVGIDHRADLYSLGVIVFRLIAGRAPFVGEGEGDVLAAHIHVPPPTLSSLVPDVPPAIERLVAALLQKAPGDRPQTAEQVIAMIDAAQAHSSTGPELTRTPSPPPQMLPQPSSTLTTLSSAATPAPTNPDRDARPPRGNGLLYAVLGGSVVAGVIIALVVARKQDSPAPVAQANEHSVEMKTTAAAAAPTPTPTPTSTATATPTPTPTPTPTATPPAAGSDGPVEAATVAIHVVSTPAGADVLRGSEKLGTTPFDGTLARGDAAVKLTLRKSGYKDGVLSVVPTAAIDQKVVLQPRAKATTPTARDKSVNPF